MQPQVYGLARSVYTRIARLALEEKGAPYALHDVEIFGAGGAPAEHLARHPFGRIPAFEHEGFWLYETAAITRYVDEAFDGPPLQPATPRERARMNQVIGVIDAYAYRPMIWDVLVERVLKPMEQKPSDEARIAAGVKAADVCLRALVQIAPCAPHLLGPTLTLADLHAYPVLRYYALAPEGQTALQRHPGLQRWLAMMRERAAVLRTRSPREAALDASA
jgi:glutathione S-transferase